MRYSTEPFQRHSLLLATPTGRGYLSFNINIGTISGDKVQVGNNNNQTNIHNNSQVFNNIRTKIKNEIKNITEREIILEKLQNLEASIDSKDSLYHYQEFINSAASYMTILAPLLPALTQLVN